MPPEFPSPTGCSPRRAKGEVTVTAMRGGAPVVQQSPKDSAREPARPRSKQGSGGKPDPAAGSRDLQIRLPRVAREGNEECSESPRPVQLFSLCTDKDLYRIFSFLCLHEALETVILVDKRWSGAFFASFSLERVIFIGSKEASISTAQAECGDENALATRKYVSAATIERVLTLAGASNTAASRNSPSSLSSKKDDILQLSHVTSLTLESVVLSGSLGAILGAHATSLATLRVGAFRAERGSAGHPPRRRHNSRALAQLLRQCGSGLRNLLLDPASSGPLSEEVFEGMPKLLSVGAADAKASRMHSGSRLKSRNRLCAAGGGPVDSCALYSALCALPGHALLQAVANTAEAFLLTDLRGLTVACNQGFYDAFGYSTSEMHGLKWDYLLSCSLTDASAVERADDAVKQLILRPESASHGMQVPTELCTAFCRKDGSAVLAQVLLLPDALTSKNLVLTEECFGPAFIARLRAVECCDGGSEESEGGGEFEQGSFSLSQRPRHYHVLRFGVLSEEFTLVEEEGEGEGESEAEDSGGE